MAGRPEDRAIMDELAPPALISPGLTVAAGLPASPASEPLAPILRELAAATKELLEVSREQLELLRKAEDRHRRQNDAQREEFQRWLNEHPGLGGRSHQAAEFLRLLVGDGLARLVDHVEEHQDTLADNDYSRSELLDRHGSLVGQLSSVYSMVKRLSLVEKHSGDQDAPG